MNLSVPSQAAGEAVQQPVSDSMASPYGAYGRKSGFSAHIARLFSDQTQRHEIIAQAAYFRAKHRGFAPGHELDDWLAAENEVDSELAVGPRL